MTRMLGVIKSRPGGLPGRPPWVGGAGDDQKTGGEKTMGMEFVETRDPPVNLVGRWIF